ncbi:MAG: ribonuclease P protein component [Bacteroidales bacterium]|nr:ribonuclease P protein component [Bacteroidales bacterium]
MPAFGYPKKQRINSRNDIVSLIDKGGVVFRHPFKVYFRTNECGYPRFAISVPKKNFKRAVARNLLKRRTKEAIRLNIGTFQGCSKFDFLFVYVAKDIVEYSRISEKVTEIFSEVSPKND